jgi:hypothetical protein
MKQMVTGVALVLALALTSLGFAQGGPPVPDGCIFERGTTTCTEVVTVRAVIAGGGYPLPGGCHITFTTYQITVTTTVSTYFGVSKVQKDDPVVTVDESRETVTVQVCPN